MPRLRDASATPTRPTRAARAPVGPAVRRGSSSSATWCSTSCSRRPGRSRRGTDVPGRVALRPGRLGGEHRPLARPARARGRRSIARGRARRGGPGARRRGPRPTASRRASSASPGARTGRIGVLVAPGGERSFVADRGAADLLAAGRPRAGVVRAAPTRSTCRPTRCSASRSGSPGRRAVELARARRARRQRRPRLDRAAARRTAGGRPARSIAEVAPGPPVRDRRRGRGAPRAATPSRGCSSSRRSPSSSAAPKGATVLARDGDERAPLRGRDRARRRAPTRPAPATPSTPGSSSAGSRRARPGGRCRRRSSGRPWPAIARRRRQLTTPRPELSLSAERAGQARAQVAVEPVEHPRHAGRSGGPAGPTMT